MKQGTLKNKHLNLNFDNSKREAINIGISFLRGIFLFSLCFVVLYPVIYMLSMSLRESSDLYDPTVIWIAKNWTISNYVEIIDTMEYGTKLFNTTYISIIATFLNVMICAIVGYGFARFRFPFKNILFGLVVFTLIVPSSTLTIPLYAQYQAFDFLGLGQVGKLFSEYAVTINLLNTPFTIFVPALFGQGIRSGIFIYIFRQFFRGLPKELEEAAYIDGCGTWKTFITIMLPNATAAIITCILFSLVWYWNDYFFTNMFFNEPITLSTTLGNLESLLRSEGMNNYVDPYSQVVQMKSACILVMLPMLLLYVFLQRYFTQAIDKTGIVG